MADSSKDGEMMDEQVVAVVVAVVRLLFDNVGVLAVGAVNVKWWCGL